MESKNRIEQLSTAVTVARQTPKNEFGEVLAESSGTAASVGGGLISGLSQGSPVLSAAVSSVSALTSTLTSGVLTVGAGPSSTLPGASSRTGASSSRGDSWDLLQAQDLQSKEYLSLQNEMQRESREFNAVSNIIKVRHDSAKAAINNIR